MGYTLISFPPTPDYGEQVIAKMVNTPITVVALGKGKTLVWVRGLSNS